jgi:hypothetical protein
LGWINKSWRSPQSDNSLGFEVYKLSVDKNVKKTSDNFLTKVNKQTGSYNIYFYTVFDIVERGYYKHVNRF